MALSAGSRLGPYEIVSPLGAGGMGEVYRARDTRLGRDVAIKVLASSLSSNEELKMRFEREARAISALQHPHICVLHDVGCDNGIDFLVMEYLEGESLHDRVKRGPLPIDQLLRIATEVADALDKAHRAGLIHRDLKPGNIMLTKSGAKLLDFGLAKPAVAIAAGAPSSGASKSVFAAAMTLTSPASPLTSAGSIVGTVQYMSPEQIEGREADARSDIFSFGLVLYEMATGKRAFEGKTQASIVASILALDPPAVMSLQPTTPASLAKLIHDCLNKDADERLQSAHDLKLQLELIAQLPSVAPAKTLRSWQIWTPWFAAAALALTMAVGWMALARKAPLPAATAFQFDVGDLHILGTASGARIAISPDGRTIALVLREKVKPQIYLRRLGSLELALVPGSEGAAQPFFSPDGKWLGFSAESKLKKVPLAGGLPVTICDLQSVDAPAVWGDDGNIVISNVGALESVSDGGGTPKPIGSGKQSDRYVWLSMLPGSRALLAVTRAQRQFDIALVRLDTGKSEIIIRGGSWPRYLSSGYIVYAQHSATTDSGGFTGGLLAVPFDLKRLKLTGSPVPVLQEVHMGSGGAGFYDISASGTLVYSAGASEGNSPMELVSVDRTGKAVTLSAAQHHAHDLVLSPDETRLAFSSAGTDPDIYLYDLKRGTTQRLTFDGHSTDPVFTPDGKRLVFTTVNGSAKWNLWIKSADGAGDAERLGNSPYRQFPAAFSPDGSTLVFSEIRPETRSDIYLLSMKDHTARPLLNSKFNENQGRISPDGNWFAYCSYESGEGEVYVQAFPGPGGKRQISTAGGVGPRWSHDGRQLYYVGAPNSLMVVDVNSRAGFEPGTPRLLVQGIDWMHSGYAVTRDGHIYAGRSLQGPEREKEDLRVIENFETDVLNKMGAPKQ
jgi:eukaryotic-like serine/threonine-protein kinase